jgi:hypothetical protein
MTKTIELTTEELQDVIAILEKQWEQTEDMPEAYAIKRLIETFQNS